MSSTSAKLRFRLLRPALGSSSDGGQRSGHWMRSVHSARQQRLAARARQHAMRHGQTIGDQVRAACGAKRVAAREQQRHALALDVKALEADAAFHGRRRHAISWALDLGHVPRHDNLAVRVRQPIGLQPPFPVARAHERHFRSHFRVFGRHAPAPSWLWTSMP